MITKLVYRFVAECHRSTYADDEPEARKNLRDVIEGIEGFKKAFKVKVEEKISSRLNDAPGGSIEEFIFSFSFDAKGDSGMFSDLPRAFTHFCKIHFMQKATHDIYLQDEDLD